MERNKVFIDTSILITALLSSRGGSFYILTQHRDTFKFCINEYVLKETLGVLKRKFSFRKELEHNLFLLIGFARIEILPNPSRSALVEMGSVIEEKDAPILASAVAHCKYLLTLDHDFLDKEVQHFAKKRYLTIYTPKEFVESLENN